MTRPYRDPALPVAARVADLLARMTPRELVLQLSARYWGRTPTGMFADIPEAEMATALADGIGQICQLGKRRTRREAAVLANRVQRVCRERTRLGIPALIHEETLHGMIANSVTCLPGPMTLAASWDPGLVEEGFALVGGEMRRSGHHLGLSPVLDLGRDPRWGRQQETFGEDPALVAAMGVAAVRGLQGRGPGIERDRVCATGKHFAGYGQGEGGHNVGPFAASRFELASAHLVPWRAVIRDAGLGAVMPSYAAVEGVPAHGDPWLLDEVLRRRLGFAGVVVSDYGGVAEMHDLHHVAEDQAAAARLAILAGMDCELPAGECYEAHLERLMAQDPAVAVAVRRSVARVLELKFRLGLFEEPFVDEGVAEARAPGADALAQRLAEESVVLLANRDGVLPLAAERLKRVAVIGPHAHENLLGPYYGTPERSWSYVDGLRAVLGTGVEVVHAPGCRITGPALDADGEPNRRDPGKDHSTARLSTPEDDARAIAEAARLAAGCEVVVLVLGDNLATTRESFRATPQGDRADLGLPGGQRALFDRLRALGVPLVVVLARSGVIADAHLVAHAPTLVDAGVPGQAGGLAVARVLCGLAEPGGRLPVTVPRSAGHLPCHGGFAGAARRGYGFEPASPLFPFGFGLSYTTWRLEAPELASSSLRCGGSARVRVRIANTGPRAGSETVQVYHRDRVASRTRPRRELVAFAKVRLAPGEAATVELEVPAERLGWLDHEHGPVQEPGVHTLWVTTGADPLGGTELVLTVTA